jgi:hypothetical protein
MLHRGWLGSGAPSFRTVVVRSVKRYLANADASKFRILYIPPIGSLVTIKKLYISPGSSVHSYDLCCDVDSVGVTLQSPSEVTSMQIEIIEDMFVKKVYCRVGDTLKPGDPLALLSEDNDLADDEVPSGVAAALWQAYVTTKMSGCGCS